MNNNNFQNRIKFALFISNFKSMTALAKHLNIRVNTINDAFKRPPRPETLQKILEPLEVSYRWVESGLSSDFTLLVRYEGWLSMLHHKVPTKYLIVWDYLCYHYAETRNIYNHSDTTLDFCYTVIAAIDKVNKETQKDFASADGIFERLEKYQYKKDNSLRWNLLKTGISGQYGGVMIDLYKAAEANLVNTPKEHPPLQLPGIAPEDFREIPFYPDEIAAGQPLEIRDAPEGIVIIHKNWCKQPEHMVAVRVSSTGTSMEPTIPAGAIVTIDTSMTAPKTLLGQTVAIYKKDDGATIKRLAQTTKGWCGIPDNRDPRHQVIMLEEGDRIIGKVNSVHYAL